jgi:alpha-ribazole phosphatase
MRTLVLLRHGMTEANERRVYCGHTDLPLSEGGQKQAREMAAHRPLPECDLYLSSGMARADETLFILTGRKADRVLPALSEMDFGRFEMLDYDTLKQDADYRRWIEDATGRFACPGGESAEAFRRRVLSAGEALLALAWESALVVCHGGVIVNLMREWFPLQERGFYEWQPSACGGWRVSFEQRKPIRFEPV